MPVSKLRPEDTYEAFMLDEPLKKAAKRLGVTANTLRSWWVRKFGQEAVDNRSLKHARGTKASQEELLAPFETDEPFKSVAARLKVSPNTLRDLWVEKFGQEAFDARGKAQHVQAGTRVGRSKAGVIHQRTLEDHPCEVCQKSVTLNQFQLARTSRVLCVTCSEVERGVDRHCPVCGLGLVGEKGLTGHLYRPTTGDPTAHASYVQAQLDAIWEGKEEGRDYIVCLECRHKGVRIDRHLMAEHRMSVETYRAYHPEASVQAETLREARSVSAVAQHQAQPLKGLTKDLACPTCGKTRPVPLTLAPSVHEVRCPECIDDAEEAHWASLVEGEDYVTCQVCGERADSLVSHVRNAHPEIEGKYLETFPGAQMTSLNSAIRDKPTLRGRKLSDEVRAKMSANAGRWNKGLTKETDARMAQAAANMVGRKAWRKGMTKDSHPGVLRTAEKMRIYRSQHFWSNGNAVSLDRSQLLPFVRKNGKISVGKAIASLGHAFQTIRRECKRHGLEVSRSVVAQSEVLEIISTLLGGAQYETEWNDGSFINPETGRYFRFDGYFPDQHLLVEFMGHQHYTPDSVWFHKEGSYEKLQGRDKMKAALVEADDRFRLFVIREDEPYTDPDYLLSRLIDEGIFDPGK